MPSTSAPYIRMAMGIPVACGGGDGGADLLPGLEAPALERQGAQHLPPGFYEVEVGGVDRLEDELPARVGQRPEQHVGGPVRAQVVLDRVDRLGLRPHP